MVYPNIQAEMERCNCTIYTLVDSLGLPADTISRKLSGQEEFTLAEIDRLADLFGCTLDYLTGRGILSHGENLESKDPVQ